MRLRPFFSYYGAKYQMARRLGPPQRDIVIEPFAGSACYSCYWAGHAKQVILVDCDPIIAGLWRYLIRVKEKEILSLPTEIDRVDQIKACEEARWLVGWWFNKGIARPAKTRSHWASDPQFRDSLWGERIKQRIASQLKHIRHWKIIEGSYENAPKQEAHWHVDPPYQRAGVGYKFHDIDYAALARWCQSLDGFVQVCEAADATWLPFTEFAQTCGPRKHSREGVYQIGEAQGLEMFTIGSR